jgi:hypothetical protein
METLYRKNKETDSLGAPYILGLKAGVLRRKR